MSDATNKYLDLTGLGQLVTKIDDAYLKKVTSSTTYRQLYSKNADGTQAMVNAAANAVANSLIYRDANMRAKVANPSDNNDIANKAYVDGLVPQIRKFVR